MIYSDGIKSEMNNILEAFMRYIESQDYFDIVYSQKAGFLWIVIDSSGNITAEALGSPEKMMAYLFNDIIVGVINSPENKSRCSDSPTLTTYEKIESSHIIAEIIESIRSMKKQYLSYMEHFINAYPKSLQMAILQSN